MASIGYAGEAAEVEANFASTVERADQCMGDLLARIERLANTLIGASPPSPDQSAAKVRAIPNGLLANVEDKAEAIIGKTQIAHGLLDRIDRALP